MKALALSVSRRGHHPLSAPIRRLGRWLCALPQTLWHTACRHAERPQRVVPYC